MKPAFIFVVLLLPLIEGKKLETVGDDELLKLVQTEKNVIALFAKPNCETCQLFEHELSMAREVLVDSLGAWVVKLVSSPLAKLYSPTLEPAVVYFRNGSPMLYNGPINEDEIISILQRGQTPAVKELNDETFEHLTQAGTGATTGDWLVMFYKQSCVTSQRLQAVFESVGTELKNRINTARVDKGGSGGVTGRRFGVSGLGPTFLLFRHGKVYKYELDTITIPNLINFAQEFYRNSKGVPVPPPKSPFDDFTEMVAEKIKDNPEIVRYGSIGLAGFVLLIILLKFYSGNGSSSKKSSKKETTKKKK